MQRPLIWWLNCLFLALIAILIIGGLGLWGARSTLEQPTIVFRKNGLSTTSFSPKDYSSLGNSGLQLSYQQPKMGVPDLSKVLNYRGHNMRPDARGKEVLFFSLGHSETLFAVPVGKEQYLVTKNNGDEPYEISFENRPTSLWFESELRGNQAIIRVWIKDERGNIIHEPLEKGVFTLVEKPTTTQNKSFMIDSLRADPTLLSRQKVRWSGKDQFLEDHGGEVFEREQGKQRIVFGEGDNLYALYVDRGDILIWSGGRWKMPDLGEDTSSFPLLRVNKIEDRVMSLELFDVSGKIKVNLNLLRLSEPPLQPLLIMQDFQFVGARTKVHSLFKINNKREIVGPEDWFLLTQEGWKKLKTRKEIDAYVGGQLQGLLLVINGIGGGNEEKWLEATLYNRTRSQSESVVIPLETVLKP